MLKAVLILIKEALQIKKAHQVQQDKTVWHIGQVIHGNLFILQVQIDDEKRAGGSRARQDYRREKLLKYNYDYRNQRKGYQYAVNLGRNLSAVDLHHDNAHNTVDIKNNIGGGDQPPLRITLRPVDIEQLFYKGVHQHQQDIDNPRYAAETDDFSQAFFISVDDRGGIKKIDQPHQRRQQIVDHGHQPDEREGHCFIMHYHNSGQDVAGHSAKGDQKTSLKQLILQGGQYSAAPGIHPNNSQDYHRYTLGCNIPTHAAVLHSIVSILACSAE